MLPVETQILNKGLRERVADIVRSGIVGGRLKPGDPLQESVLAGEFSLSSRPIREALLQLEQEGLVRNFHNHGWYVTELSLSEISEIISLRVPLEVLTLKLAARNIRKDELNNLAHIQKKLMEAFWDLDWKLATNEVVQRDFEFHDYIWKISNHKLLRDTLVRTTRPYFAYTQATLPNMVSSQQQYHKEYADSFLSHQGLIDYLEEPSKFSAELCVYQHLAPASIKGWDRLVTL